MLRAVLGMAVAAGLALAATAGPSDRDAARATGVAEPTRQIDALLGTAFRNTRGVSVAVDGRRRLLAVTGELEDGTQDHGLRLFTYDGGTQVEELTSPFRSVSGRERVRAVAVRGTWCLSADTTRDGFSVACRRIGAPPAAGWTSLPHPPGAPGTRCTIVAVRDVLFCVVIAASGPRYSATAYARQKGRWALRGAMNVGRAPVVTAMAIRGRLTIVAVKSLAPRFRAWRLGGIGHWTRLDSPRAARRLSALAPVAWVPDMADVRGRGLYAGVSRSDGRRLRFGVASLESGRFSAAPSAPPRSQAQGVVVGARGGGAWAIWRTLLLPPRPGPLGEVVRVAHWTPRTTWKEALRRSLVIRRGPHLLGDPAVVSLGTSDYLLALTVHRERIVYQLTRLRRSARSGQ